MRNRSQERPRPGRAALAGVVAVVALGSVAAGVGLAAARSTDVVERPLAPGPLCAPYVVPLGPFAHVGSAPSAYTCPAPRKEPTVVSI